MRATCFVVAFGLSTAVLADDGGQNLRVFGQRVTVFRLKQIDAEEAARQLRKTLGGENTPEGIDAEVGFVCVPDKSSNTLVLVASPGVSDIARWRILCLEGDAIVRNNPDSTGCFDSASVICCYSLNEHAVTESMELSRFVDNWLTDPRVKPLEANRAKVINVLAQNVSFYFSNKTLKSVMNEIGCSADLDIVVDADGIREVGVSPDTPVNLHVTDIKLGTAIDEMLSPLHLGYRFENEVLKITNLSRLNAPMITVVYPVPDLVVTIRDNDAVVDFEAVVHEVESAFASGTWERNGGDATVRSAREQLCLVIRHTKAGHQRIEKVLAAMRDKRDNEIRRRVTIREK